VAILSANGLPAAANEGAPVITAYVLTATVPADLAGDDRGITPELLVHLPDSAQPRVGAVG
jgi:hypothetical protein